MPDAGQVRLALTKALNVWERSSKLTFRETRSEQADIQVLFARRDHGDGYKFDGPGQVLAHAFYPGVGRGGDAHFDAEEKWQFSDASNSDGTYTNFMGVAVHEFGHSFGLGHSSDQNAIMFPWYQGNDMNKELPADDRLAIQELYGAKSKTWGPIAPRPTTTTTTTTAKPLVYYPDEPRYPAQYPYDPRYPAQYPDEPRYPPQYPTRRTYYRPHWQQTEPTTRRTTTTTTTRRPTHRTPTTKHWHRYHKTMAPKRVKPDQCLTNYDAISIIRRELFIFKGLYLWRFTQQGSLYAGYPHETRRLWQQLPENYKKIDAVYENKEGKIVFFIGRHYYVFNSITLEAGYPQPLTSLGLPATLSHIDAAFVWGHNNRTYFFSGTLYWRFDEDERRVELDYPRDMSIWSGIGYNIDAAFQDTNRKTYFFKNLGYWEFNDDRMRVAHRKPKLSARKWMHCPRLTNEVDEEQIWTAPLVAESNEQEHDFLGINVHGRALATHASGAVANNFEVNSRLPVLLCCISILLLTSWLGR